MRELFDALPDGELTIGRRNVSGDEFKGGFASRGILQFRKEDRAVIGATEETEQMKLIVDKIAFALFPDVRHDAPLQTMRIVCGRRHLGLRVLP